MHIMHEIVAGKKEVLSALGLDKHSALERGLDLIGVSLFNLLALNATIIVFDFDGIGYVKLFFWLFRFWHSFSLFTFVMAKS